MAWKTNDIASTLTLESDCCRVVSEYENLIHIPCRCGSKQTGNKDEKNERFYKNYYWTNFIIIWILAFWGILWWKSDIGLPKWKYSLFCQIVFNSIYKLGKTFSLKHAACEMLSIFIYKMKKFDLMIWLDDFPLKWLVCSASI